MVIRKAHFLGKTYNHFLITKQNKIEYNLFNERPFVNKLQNRVDHLKAQTN